MVVMAPKPCRVLVSRESAAEDRQGFCLVLALAVSASELTSGEVQVPFRWSKCYVYLKRGETFHACRGERKTAHRVRVLGSMLRQMWRGYRHQVGIAFPQLNPRFMFIYEGRVFRIRPKEMIILSPIHYQTFLEIRNTAWCVTVPILEYTLAMSKFIKQEMVTELIPND